MTHQLIYGPYVDRSEKQDRSWTQDSWFSRKIFLPKNCQFCVTLVSNKSSLTLRHQWHRITKWPLSDIIWHVMCPYLVQGLSDDPSFADDTNISVELLKNMKIYTIERFHSWQLFWQFTFLILSLLKKVRNSGHVNLGSGEWMWVILRLE